MDCTESVDCFWYNGHFIPFILQIHEHELSLYLLLSFLFIFISISQFLVNSSFTSLVKFISQCLILSNVSGIVFLISLSDILLLVYKNANDFLY